MSLDNMSSRNAKKSVFMTQVTMSSDAFSVGKQHPFFFFFLNHGTLMLRNTVKEMIYLMMSMTTSQDLLLRYN